MIVSMTGFGRAQSRDKQTQLNLQIRSVNCRFFEVAFHMPESLSYLESRIKKYLHARLKRGRISFNFSISGPLAGKATIDKELARQYYNSLRRLRRELSMPGEVTLEQLSSFPGVVSLKENHLPESAIWPKIAKLLSLACNNLLGGRIKEGKAIARDISGRLSTVNKKLLFIRRRLPLVIANKRKQLKGAASNTEEISAIIRNCDISEEIMRLSFHLKNFVRKVNSARCYGPQGKELDFIAQEMQREANTIGAKSQDANLSAAVIEIKSQIEKIREQLQNIE